MRHIPSFIVAAMLLPLAASQAAPQSGTPRCAEDGDGGACVWGKAEGIEIGAVRMRGLRIQLVGIVAPAARDLCGGKPDFPCSRPSRRRLAELVAGGVACDILDSGGDGLLGRCRGVDGDLGRLLVRAGLARAAKDGPYDGEQSDAIKAKRGLWADDITPPRDWENARRRTERD